MVHNKSRHACKGYSQIYGIDLNETFTHVARIKVVVLLLAYPSYINFKFIIWMLSQHFLMMSR